VIPPFASSVYFDRDQRIFVITVTTHRSKDFIYNMRLQLDASGA
jgi:hypothetical protein